MTREQLEFFLRRQIVKAMPKPLVMTDELDKKINASVNAITAIWVQDMKIVEYETIQRVHGAQLLSSPTVNLDVLEANVTRAMTDLAKLLGDIKQQTRERNT